MDQADQQYAFHRLARSWPRYRWWRPLVTGLLGLAIYLVLTVLLIVVGALVAIATSADTQQVLAAMEAMDLRNPAVFAFTLLSLILMIPALGLAALILGPRPVGLLSSVAGRLRWRWLATCALAALAVFLVSLLVSTLLTVFFPQDGVLPPVQQNTSTLWIMLALSVLAVPFQAAAEEYVFRGFLMQAIGSWLRHPAFAIVLPIPLFVVGHVYDPLGQADVAIFALFAGWISWRTGGLEAAIAVHAVNNMTIFAMGAFGLVDVNATEGSVGGLIGSTATMAVTAAVIVRLADRRGIARTRGAAPVLARYAPPAPAPAGGVRYSGTLPSSPTSGPGWSWDPAQYGTGRFDDASRPASASQPVPSAPQRAPQHVPPISQPISQPTPPAGSVPLRHAGRQDPSGTGAAGTQSTRGADQERDYVPDRHPGGPSHPGGPGHPSGTPHPSGPGYPERSGPERSDAARSGPERSDSERDPGR